MEATAQDRVSLKPETLGSVRAGLGLVGILCLLGAAVGWYRNPEAFAYSWLWAFTVFYTLCAGSFFWMILQHATNSGWSTLVRRQLENMAACFGVMALFFIPLLPFFKTAPSLWEWMRPEAAHDPLFQAKAAYFAWPFYWARLIAYFGFFAGMACWFRRRSCQQDSDGNPVHTVKMQKWSFGCIAGFAVCLTFSAFDWLMALNYHWYSTMWGVYIFAGSAGSSMALLSIILHMIKSKGYLPQVNEEHFHIIGKLMFAFTVFWSYIGFSQFMLIWYANIPEETIFFKIRNTAQWFPVSMFLVAGHFVFPFLLLLTQAAKKTPWRLLSIAGWMLLMHVVDLYWIIMPEFQKSPMPGNWKHLILHLLCFVGIGSIVALQFLKNLTSANLYPVKDPRLDESIHVKN